MALGAAAKPLEGDGEWDFELKDNCTKEWACSLQSMYLFETLGMEVQQMPSVNSIMVPCRCIKMMRTLN